ncbi:MAG: addiction module protein [Leptospiraceae bacterium]|nr:addiction module protein [Leptospiraceae bacterium]
MSNIDALTVAELKVRSLSEKLEALDELWNSISEQESLSSVSDWEREIIESRWANYQKSRNSEASEVVRRRIEQDSGI